MGLPSSIQVAAGKGSRSSPTTFPGLLRHNRNYRYTWLGQIVSEIGDHFNTIAVFSLVLERTGSGLVVSGIMLARAVPMILAGLYLMLTAKGRRVRVEPVAGTESVA